jgi:hypothetical protein
VSCPRKFYWEFIRQYGAGKTSIHLHFGASFAKGVEVFREAFYGQKKSWDDSMHDGLLAIMREWGDYEEDEGSVKTFPVCCLALVSYFTEFAPATDPIQPWTKSDGSPAVEFSFALPIPEVPHPVTGDPLIFCGRFDMLGLFNSQLMVVDEKTCSQLGATFASQWDLRAQFLAYTYAARQYGYPVMGAIVRATCIKKSGLAHTTVTVQCPEWLVNQWYEQLVRDLKRMVENFREGFWDQNFADSCTSYSGCSFKRLCTSRDPERWLEAYYVPRVWDPSARDQLKGNEK